MTTIGVHLDVPGGILYAGTLHTAIRRRRTTSTFTFDTEYLCQ